MQSGSPGARWFRLSMEQLREKLVGSGKQQPHEVDRMLQLFEDPAFAAMSPVIMAAWGRRPPVRVRVTAFCLAGTSFYPEEKTSH